jgi:murein DD-endopeptidase MepM/ murein hydrolase activator NlpD
MMPVPTSHFGRTASWYRSLIPERQTSELMRVSPRLVALALAVGLALVPATGAHASTADDLDAARHRLDQARDDANTAAAAFSASDHKLEETRNEIATLQSTIAATKLHQAELRDVARRRAVYAYTHSGTNDLEAMIDAESSADAVRRTQLLDHANQTDSEVVKKLTVVNDQLKEQQDQLEQEQSDEQAVSDQLEVKLRALEAKQAEVEQAVSDLQGKLDLELASAAAAADAAHKAELEKERLALQAQQLTSAGGAGQIVPNPVPGPFQCPVSGAAYSDDYGGPTGHPGIDMFVPTGTAAVAVKAGTVRYVANEGAGGNTAYLAADDGNSYFYAHLSQFVGEGRTVARGEIIGLTGMTGNASAPHLHFEIRLGGDNGARTDPYPTLKSAGC